MRYQPIAVTGIGCRLPGGVDSPESFWRLLLGGRDGIGPLPPDRWEPYATGPAVAAALRRTSAAGGFLSGIYGFDAAFFGLSRREAELMDPQQRLALEVGWEALEHAGIPPDSLAGTDAGVFMGVNSDDYGRRLLEDLPRIEAWTGIGSSLCAVANRISYHMDLRGPSMAVDTACSSSLVTLHLACRSLQHGETSLALAGGVMLMAAPGLTMVMDACGALAPDGRSKSFDASADGYGRGEGCGVLVLKRLSDAERDGDRVLAVIRGSAVRQDGRTDGIMAPSQQAQEHLLREAYRDAGVPPESVDYVEAHGTGTRAGDPVEAGALGTVLGAGRPAGQACLIGSVKTNIGHLEAASGVAGVIKTVLALRHRWIPASLNVTEPNPAIRWDESGLRVVADATDWPRRDRPRRAGVSGYGYGGTIAHLVLEESPEQAASAGDHSPACGQLRLYPLSAGSADGLRGLATRLADRLDADQATVDAAAGAHASAGTASELADPAATHGTAAAAADPAAAADAAAGTAGELADVGHTLALRRSHLDHRATVLATDRAELLDGLRRLARDEPAHRVAAGRVLPAANDPGPVWVFSGHGSQWAGMGRGLLDTEPAFAQVLAELEPVFAAELGLSPRQALLGGQLADIGQVQSMIFAVQLGLAEVWRSYGLRPAALIGHSVGEVAAAVVAGVFDPADGARLICRRSRQLRRVAGRGGMAMVSLPFAEVAGRLRGRADVTAAISASPGSTVVSGDAAAVAELVRAWRAGGDLLVQPVQSEVAFHSAQMDPILADLRADLAGLRPRRPQVRSYPTAVDDPRSDPPRDSAYWAGNLRQPVRFAGAVAAALADGHRVFLEVSPHPVVVQSVREAIAEAGVDDAVVGYTLRRHRPDRAELLGNLGAMHCAGLPVDWTRVHPDGRLTDLPGIGWQHRDYRVTAPAGGTGAARPPDPAGHTLLGADLTVHGPSPVRVWQTALDRDGRPYPGDHPVRGVEVVPACVLLNTFFTAAAAAAGDEAFPALADVALRVPVAVTDEPHELQVVHSGGALTLSSRPARADGEGWLTHTTAVVAAESAQRWVAGQRPARDGCDPPAEPVDPGFVVDRLASIGVAGMGFPWRVDELRSAPGALAAVVGVDRAGAQPASWASTLDAALSIASVVFGGPPRLRMPAHVGRVAVHGQPPARVRVEARIAGAGDGGPDAVDVDVRAEDGRPVARLDGVRYREVDGDVPAPADPSRLVHELVWRPAELPAPAGDLRRAVLVGADDKLAEPVVAALAAAGVACRRVDSPDELLASAAGGALAEDLDGTAAVLVVPAGGGGRSAAEAAQDGAWRLIRTAQLLAGSGRADRPCLCCLTVGVREGGSAAALAGAPLWGVARVVGGEHPELRAGIVDLDARDLAGSAGRLADLLRSGPGEDVLAPRGGTVLAARLARLARDRDRAGGLPYCRPHGTYLVTGGLGALGLQTASWLAGHGARRMVLAGRHPLPPRDRWDEVTDPAVARRIEAVRALEAAGVTVRTVALDVADRGTAADRLAAATADLPPVLGVVHAAGVLDNRLVRDVDEASLRTVLPSKVDGAMLLHELFPPGTLDFFVLFSSAGLLLGLPGQASYAAGNGFLDGLARHRRARGDRGAVSLGWTSWRGLGMSTSSEIIDAELAARGTADITAADAFRCWEYAAGAEPAQLAVLRTLSPPPGGQLPALLRDLPADDPAQPAEPAADEVRWAGLAGDRLRDALLAEVAEHVAAELKLGPDELDARRPLAEMGLDSVLTQAIRRRLEVRLRIGLPATLLWEHRTVAAVADHLTARLSEQDIPSPSDADPTDDPETEVPMTRPGVVPWPAEAAERYRAAGHWRGRPLGAVMWSWADRYGDRVAVVDGDRRLGYRELAEHVDALAAGLADLGLGNGDNIVVQLPNSWESLVLFLACQRIGVAPVLALLAHREHELSYLGELTEAKAIVVPDRWQDFDHQDLAARLVKETDRQCRVLVVGDRVAEQDGHVDVRRMIRPGADPAGLRRRLDALAPDPGEVALFLLSGGTTGIPKIIARTHDDYEYNARQSGAVCGFDEDTVYLVTLPMAHNFPLGSPGILATLIGGGRVVLAPSPRPEVTFPLIDREQVTVTSLVPAIARRWVDAAALDGRAGLTSLRFVQVGGSVLAPEAAAAIGDGLGCALQQVYGMAEGLLNYTRLDDPPEVVLTTQGRPISPDDEVRIVDGDDRPVPPGTPGELLTRGPYTPRGYFRAPEHNARAFTPDGWYRSGDIVRLRPDGNLVVEGRVKDLVNRGGEKIPAGEVEALVEGLPEVRTAAAVPVPDPELGERVGVCVVLHPGCSLSLAEVRDAFEDNGVARFKIPEYLRVLPELPLTPVGKVDKKLLATLVTKGEEAR
jgi:6-methylsalicylic acid synthase